MIAVMGRWEYAEIRKAGNVVWWTGPDADHRLDDRSVADHRSRVGRDGWELVAATETVNWGLLGAHDRVARYTLKRPVADS